MATRLSHVANGDMVTLTLLQGVLNTFVIFLARIIGGIVDRAVFRNDREGSGIGFFLTTMVAQFVLGILASMIVSWFSRYREFRADRGGANLARHRQHDRRPRGAEAQPGRADAARRCRHSASTPADRAD